MKAGARPPYHGPACAHCPSFGKKAVHRLNADPSERCSLSTCRLKILVDLRFKLTFEFFIGFELHTIHTSKIMPVSVLS